jgi:hypothetical protein
VDPDTLYADFPTTVQCNVKNTGDSSAIASTLRYYFSADQVLDAADTNIGFSIINALAGNTQVPVVKTVTIPDTTSPGTYYLLYFADADSTVNEADEVNNLNWHKVVIEETPPVLELDLKLYLAGPYDKGLDEMKHALPSLPGGAFPLSQPFSTPPWNYNGLESVAAIPADVVDWILVEVRDAPSAATATAGTIKDRQACFLLKDGSVTQVDGTSLPLFYANITNGLYVAVWHRNHLAVISSSALSESAGVYPYNFTDNQAKAFQKTSITSNSAMVEMETGVFGLWAGDANADDEVKYNSTGNDRQPILTKVGSTTISNAVQGYNPEDLNLDGYLTYSGKKNDKIVIYNTLGGDINGTWKAHIPD